MVVDKPSGVTSHDVVDQVRRERGGKVGHAGTLDPFATGVLTILLGRATRLQRYLLGLPKTYLATAKLGWTSTTGDPDGELAETGILPDRLEIPVGKDEQMVPMTSAVKVDGERLYKRAHRGQTTESRPIREIEVLRSRLVETPSGPPAVGCEVQFELEVSSGTYVRTLIESLKDAYCSALRRTAVGPLDLSQAGRVLSPRMALSFLPEVNLDDAESKVVGQGQKLDVDRLELRSPVHDRMPDRVALVHGGNLIAVARLEKSLLCPEVVLVPAS